MNSSPDVIEEGLRAWAAGNLDALEAVLDPQVSLRWVEPGPWDCTKVATRITVANGKVTRMQQYKTDAKPANQT